VYGLFYDAVLFLDCMIWDDGLADECWIVMEVEEVLMASSRYYANVCMEAARKPQKPV
jgi:hypothetical protein